MITGKEIYHGAGRKYTSENPRDYEALFRLGILLEGEGNVAKAIFCFQDCLLVFPSLVKAHFQLGINYSRKHNQDSALKEWEQVIDEDGDYQFGAMGLYNKSAIVDAIKG